MAATVNEASLPAPTAVVAPAFVEVVHTYRPAIERLCRAYQRQPAAQKDLHQEILVALWTSLPRFEGRASVRTWVYRVAHNVALTFQSRSRREPSAPTEAILDLDAEPNDFQEAWAAQDPVDAIDRSRAIERVHDLLRRMKPVDAQVFFLYLEGVEAPEISEITGLSIANVAVKVHRIKALVLRRMNAMSGAGARSATGTHGSDATWPSKRGDR